MGVDKAFLACDGAPLIERGLRVVRAAGVEDVLISGRRGQPFAALDCPVVFDPEPDQGPLGGVVEGLRVATQPLVFVMAVDLPRITSGYIDWLVRQCAGEVGAVPVLDDDREPLAAVYPKAACALAARLLSEGRLAARDFAETCVRDGLARDVPVPAEHKGCFVNWNTPGDVQA